MNKFEVSGPTCISFSGGRTSGYMLWLTLQAHGGKLPPDTHVVFANTGKEEEATLRFVRDCAERWGVEIAWIERDAEGYRETDYEHASRAGEPFAELITERRYVPNAVTRFCTQALKIETARDYMRAQGYERWTSVVGLRRDEPARVAKVRGRDHEEWDAACPLYDARVTKADVMAWWRAQPFDLALESWQSNCTLCPLKSRATLERAIRDDDAVAEWWIAQEKRIGATFRKDEPRGYEGMRERVRRLPLLPMRAADEPAESIACNCTDRVHRRRCTCGKRRGEGHALSCAVVMAKWAA